MLHSRLKKIASFSNALRKTAARGMGASASMVERQATFKSLQNKATAEAASKAAPSSAPVSTPTATAPVKQQAPAPKTAPVSPAAQKRGVMGRIANHFKNQAGKHGVLPVAGSVAGGAMLMSSAAKAPSKYKQFKQGFRPENHQI